MPKKSERSLPPLIKVADILKMNLGPSAPTSENDKL